MTSSSSSASSNSAVHTRMASSDSLRLRVRRLGKSRISRYSAGSMGLSLNRACRKAVFPDSFFPTRDVISGSTSIQPESSMLR